MQSSGLKEQMATESSLEIRVRIKNARDMQRERYRTNELNGTVSFQQLEQTARLTTNQLHTIGDICFAHKWSNRTQVRLIRIARTIADLQGTHDITHEALKEAVEWKQLPTGLQTIGGDGIGQT